MTIPIAPDQTELAGPAAAGRVWREGDPGFDAEVAAFNAAVRHRPQIVVGAASADDVAAAVRYARAHGLRVAVQSTGHGASAAVEGGVLVTTSRLDGLEIDPVARTATIEAGVRWSAVLEAAAAHGLTAVTGSAPSVGVVGLLLGGGAGPLGRTLGFASDRIRSARVVTADGELRDVDAMRDPDLFWVLRGGKRGFGIVTSVTIELVELDELIGGCLWFAAPDADSVLAAWARESGDLPEAVTSSVAMLRLPPLPELPEPLRGQFVVQVRVAVVGDGDGGFVERMRALAPRVLDTVGPMPARAIGDIHADPTEPMPVWEGGALLAGFDERAAATVVAAAGPGQDVPLAVVEVRRLGGRLRQVPEGGDAVGGRAAEYSLYVVGAPVPELLGTVVPLVGGGVIAAMQPWATGGTQANFHGAITAENPEARAWPGDVYARIQEIRRSVDPTGVFA